MPKLYLVTGGAGFLGSSLVRRLIMANHRVRVLDNAWRIRIDRLEDVKEDTEFIRADIRDPEAVRRAAKGVDSICHLAAINGTEFFYHKPDLVLDVGVRGMLNVLDACLEHQVGELMVASSSEVYQTPPVLPTDEKVPLSIPDPWNPRYSYAGSKIISELMALNYGRKFFQRVVIFRPHNVYGPDMGWEHVIPHFVLRMKELSRDAADPIRFPIKGSGKEKRAFVFIDDFTDGLELILDQGHHLAIYNIGTMDEMEIGQVASLVGEYYGAKIEIIPGEPVVGGTSRRCPDIKNLKALGYNPRRSFPDGLRITADWYDKNADKVSLSTTG